MSIDEDPAGTAARVVAVDAGRMTSVGRGPRPRAIRAVATRRPYGLPGGQTTLRYSQTPSGAKAAMMAASHASASQMSLAAGVPRTRSRTA